MKIGHTFRIVYLGNAIITCVDIIDKEMGKKLANPLFKFEMMEADQEHGETFKCRQEDIDRAFKFKDWIQVKIDESGNVIDVV